MAMPCPVRCAPKRDERVAEAMLIDLRGCPVRRRVALLVAVEAVRLGLDQRRPVAAPRAGDRLAGGLEHREHVEPVDDHARDVVALRAGRDVVDRAVVAEGRRLGVAVVLAHEHDRQLPDRGQVQRSRGRSPGSRRRRRRSRPSTASVPCVFAVSAAPQASGNAAADDAVRAEHALLDVGDVHRAALALADAGLPAHQLGRHAGDVDALGDAVAVAAVGAGDEVRVAEVRAHADRDRLLTGVEVDEARDLTVGELPHGRLLEGADQHHPLVHVEHASRRSARPCAVPSPPSGYLLRPDARLDYSVMLSRTGGHRQAAGPLVRPRRTIAAPGRCTERHCGSEGAMLTSFKPRLATRSTSPSSCA